ncbi:membrane protein [Paramyrothecium foliicola]|nr:membrane protein [Paramyrothecium foliicola]
MAPVCADPRQIVIALNPARRKAVLKLVDEIISHMASHLKASPKDLGPLSLSEELSGEQVSAAERTQKAAIAYFREWKAEFYSRLVEIINVEDNAKIQEERNTRREAMDKKKHEASNASQDLLSFDEGEAKGDHNDEVIQLHFLYRPIQTRLTTIPEEDRKEVLSCVLLLLLSTGKYSAHSRTLVMYLASSLELTQSFLNHEEAEIAHSLMESSTADSSQKEAMSAEAEAAKRQNENKFSRFWKVGLASVGGAIILGVTGGLAAPLVAGAVGGILGGVGLGGVASFLGIFWMNGALVGALFGAYGAKMTGEMMDHYAKEVEDFRFIPLNDEAGDGNNPDEKKNRRLRITVGINGWLNSEDDITRPWRILGSETEVFALRFEMETLLALGSALQDLVKSYAWKAVKAQIIKHTVLVTLKAAMWPLQILGMASQLDNPFNRASSRADKAGRLLADALINKVQGERPVTLVGYSLGAGAIHACLESLAQRHAFGLVDTVVIMGAPAPSEPSHWRTLRTVVSGRIFNVYSENDMILGFVYRMHSLAFGVAGLQAIEGVEGITNLDLSDSVSGHLRYANLTGEILRRCGFLDIKAGGEIPKDEVMRLRDEQAQGKLIDFDVNPPPESEQDGQPSAGQTSKETNLENLEPAPHQAQPHRVPTLPRPLQSEKAASTPALPTRPAPQAETEVKPPLPRRRTDGFDHTSSWFAQRRPSTRDSEHSGDEGPLTISMVNNDED